MIDDEVLADIATAEAEAAVCELDGPTLASLSWGDEPGGSVRLHESWRAEERLPEHVRTDLRIGRGDLARITAECRAAGEWLPLMIATSAWGLGDSGFGLWRTKRVAALPDVEVRLRAAVATLDADGPVAAYYHLNNDGYLHGWGPALFTRFLACLDPRALPLDVAQAAALNHLVPDDLQIEANDWGTAEYAFYLAVINRIARLQLVSPRWVEATLADRFTTQASTPATSPATTPATTSG